MSAVWIWVLIPLAGIAAGMVKDYLKFKERAGKLGTSTHQLEAEVASLKQERTELTERVENLEALVTSRLWTALSDEDLSESEREAALAKGRLQMRPKIPDPSQDGPSPQEKAERLARRLTV